MSESVESSLQKLEELQRLRENLAARKTRLTVLGEQAAADLVSINQEMQAVKTSPETIEADIEAAKKADAEALATLEKELKEYEKEIVTAEQTLEAKN